MSRINPKDISFTSQIEQNLKIEKEQSPCNGLPTTFPFCIFPPFIENICRLRIRLRLRHRLPILLHRAHDSQPHPPARSPRHTPPRPQSRHFVVAILRSGTFWLDGRVPDWYISHRWRFAYEYGDVLVDDADRDVCGSLDGCAYQLVVDRAGD